VGKIAGSERLLAFVGDCWVWDAADALLRGPVALIAFCKQSSQRVSVCPVGFSACIVCRIELNASRVAAQGLLSYRFMSRQTEGPDTM
jgi:hypothetical protein